MVMIDDTLPSGLVQTFGKSDVIFSQGSSGEEMYIVYTGKVGLYLEGTPGHKALFGKCGAKSGDKEASK